MNIIYIVYIVLPGIFILEIVARLLIAYKYKTFGTKDFLEVLSNPTHGLDGRKFNNFGEINDQILTRLFRFTTQAAYMGMSDKELQNIMARANQTDAKTIKNAYTGSKGFEKSRYRPFVGLSTKPNQNLSYAGIDELGFQGDYEHFRKPPKTKRVLIFGGSVAYGMGCTSIQNNLTNRLQERLNQKEKETNSDIRWEVINLSFIASQSISELNQNLIYSSLFSPDIILELAGFNDLFFFLRGGEGKLYTYLSQQSVINYLYSPFISKVLRWIASHSFAITAILKLLEKKSQKQEEGQLYTVW
jgi:hypothetical protein